MCDYYKDNGKESSFDKAILTLGYKPFLKKSMFTLWYTLLFPRASFFSLNLHT